MDRRHLIITLYQLGIKKPKIARLLIEESWQIQEVLEEARKSGKIPQVIPEKNKEEVFAAVFQRYALARQRKNIPEFKDSIELPLYNALEQWLNERDFSLNSIIEYCKGVVDIIALQTRVKASPSVENYRELAKIIFSNNEFDQKYSDAFTVFQPSLFIHPAPTFFERYLKKVADWEIPAPQNDEQVRLGILSTVQEHFSVAKIMLPIHEGLLKDFFESFLVLVSGREERIIRERLGLGNEKGGKTFREIGEIFALSVERISQIYDVGIEKIRKFVRSLNITQIPIMTVQDLTDLFEDAKSRIAELKSDQERLIDKQGEDPTETPFVLKSVQEELLTFFNTRIKDLDTSVRVAHGLKSIGVEYIGELVQKTEREMTKIKNFGPKSKKEICDLLSELAREEKLNKYGINIRIGMRPEELMGWKRPEDQEEKKE